MATGFEFLGKTLFELPSNSLTGSLKNAWEFPNQVGRGLGQVFDGTADPGFIYDRNSEPGTGGMFPNLGATPERLGSKNIVREASSVINESLGDIIRGWGEAIKQGSASIEDVPEVIQNNVVHFVTTTSELEPDGSFEEIDPDLTDGDVDFPPEEAPEPVWPEPGSRHPETGETQEEISARWKREEAAKAEDPPPEETPPEEELPPEELPPEDAPPEDLPPSEEPLPEDNPPEELPPPSSVADDYLSSVQNSFAAMSEEDQAGIFKSTSTGTPIEQALYDQLLNNVFAKGGIGFEIDPNDGTSLLLKVPVGIPSIGGPMRIKILNANGSLVPLPDVLEEAKDTVAAIGQGILAIPGQILDEARGALGDLEDLGGVVAGTSNKTLTEVLGEIFSGVLVEGSDTLPKTGWMGQGILGDIYDIFLKEVDDWKSGGDPSKFGGDPFPVAPADDGLPPVQPSDAPPSDAPPPESPFGEKPPEVDSDEILPLDPDLTPDLDPDLNPGLDPGLDPDLNPDLNPKDDNPKDDDPKDDDPEPDFKPESEDKDPDPSKNPVIIETTPPPETLFGDGGETVVDPPEESGGGGGGGGAGGMFEPYSGSINYGLPQFQAVPYNLKKDYNASLDRIMQESLFGNFN